MSLLDYKPYYERQLPHVQPPGATLFITSRLAGSIPLTVLEQLRAETEAIQAKLKRIGDLDQRAEETYREQRRIFGRWDAALHASANGPYWLNDPRVAETVAGSLIYRDGQVYDLMPIASCPTTYTSSLPLYAHRKAVIMPCRQLCIL